MSGCFAKAVASKPQRPPRKKEALGSRKIFRKDFFGAAQSFCACFIVNQPNPQRTGN
jgi:hypothetical protein